MKKRLLVALFLLIILPLALAHGDEIKEEKDYIATSVLFLKITAGILVLTTCLLLLFGDLLNDFNKRFFFWIMALPVILSTLYFSGAIIHENIISETGGPVHWHADYQVWVCGERINLVDPEFPKNKVGSPLFHEHGDGRIHIEGTVMNMQDVSLGNYFEVIGGDLHEGYLHYPATNGVVEVKDGDSCGGQPGNLKVYLNGNMVEDAHDYLIYPDAHVPPGDCIIISFDTTNNQITDKICESWSAKGQSYQNFQRREVRMGDRVWQ